MVLILKRDKHLINITNSETKKSVRYNLKEKSMQKYYIREACWKNVSQQYEFFKGFSLSDLEFEEEKFMTLIKKTKKLNDNCSSVSTFISRLGQVLVYENYDANDIETECYSSWYGQNRVLTKPLDFYDKHTIKFFKTYGIKVTLSLEQSFINKYKLMSDITNYLSIIDGEPENKKQFFNNSNYYSFKDNLTSLTETYNYDMKTLINFCINYALPFENIEPEKAIELLNDYYRMASIMGRNVKKYPKYLRSMHDIITANYNAYKKEYDEIAFEKLKRPELIWENKTHLIKIPNESKDVLAEGTNQNHCVGSYIPKILNGDTYIVFMRTTENPDKSCVTLEIKNKNLVTALGSYNRNPSEEEYEFIQKYCKACELNYKLNGGN